jgi:hypothetical protein
MYRLNLAIRDDAGHRILAMENSDWTILSECAFDVICQPRGRELRVVAKGDTTNSN